MTINRFLLCILVVLTGGCAGVQQPAIAYEQANHPLRDTAVFYPAAQGSALAQIPIVNGREMSCLQTGCPRWVRVLPGDNSFTIRYTRYDGVGRSVTGVTDVLIKDMKPRHVYRAHFDVVGMTFSVRTVDLGENSDFGPPKIDGTRFKASFD